MLVILLTGYLIQFFTGQADGRLRLVRSPGNDGWIRRFVCIAFET